MRKVVFKEWIPQKIENGRIVPGTSCWSNEYTGVGFFHQWAVMYEELRDGVGNITVALVELQDGRIVEVLPSNVRFVVVEEVSDLK